MKYEEMVNFVDNNILKELKALGERTTYTSSSNLFYEGQTPIVAYLLLKGNIHLLQKNKIKETLGPGSLIGVKELMENNPTLFSAMIMPKTEVCFLSKSDIFDILESQGPLSNSFSKIVSY